MKNTTNIPECYYSEQAVIGALIIDSTELDTVRAKISKKDFYKPLHGLFFERICSLADKGIIVEFITVFESLNDYSNGLSLEDASYLNELCENNPSAANILGYADKVLEKSLARNLLDKSAIFAEKLKNPGDKSINEILQDFQIDLNKIDNTQNDTSSHTMRSIMKRVIEKIEYAYYNKGALAGLSTGFKDVDSLCNGLKPAEFIIVAARPSMGKTSFVMNIAEHVAIKQHKKVIVFSLEMPADSLGNRLISSIGRINLKNTQTGTLYDEDFPRITNAFTLLDNSALEIDDKSSIDLNYLRLRVKQYIKKHGHIDLIVVDYLQLMREKGFSSNNKVGEISAISQGLKAIAKDFNVPVIALSQLNRNLESRVDKRPIMADIRESGAIEQDADLIMFIYRDEVYNDTSPDKGTAEIIISKNRNGEVGKARLAFNGQFTRFEDLKSN